MKNGWILLTALCLSACQAVKLPDFMVYDFKNDSKINLKTSQVNVISEVHYDLKAPFIEYKMPITPEQALKRWAQNRFSAVAPNSPVETYIIIEKASMQEKEQPSEKWYMLDNVEYQLDFQVKITFMLNQNTISERSVGGYEKRSLPMKSSLADKEEAWADMMNEMVQKVNKKLTHDLPSYFLEQNNQKLQQNKHLFEF